jgi:hypothetical protein
VRTRACVVAPVGIDGDRPVIDRHELGAVAEVDQRVVGTHRQRARTAEEVGDQRAASANTPLRLWRDGGAFNNLGSGAEHCVPLT